MDTPVLVGKKDFLGEYTAMIQDRWLSVNEVSEYLGVRRDTLYKWIIRRNMPAHKAGRLWKLKIEEVDGWVKSGQGASKVAKKNGLRKRK